MVTGTEGNWFHQLAVVGSLPTSRLIDHCFGVWWRPTMEWTRYPSLVALHAPPRCSLRDYICSRIVLSIKVRSNMDPRILEKMGCPARGLCSKLCPWPDLLGLLTLRCTGWLMLPMTQQLVFMCSYALTTY